MSSPVNSQKLIDRIHYDLKERLAEQSILHGVFMEVHGMGVLLSGESGIGKSELALDLINRGHRLIADDAPEFSRIGPDTVRGRCPEVLRDFLEVRGLGILNIREMYGDSAIKPSKNLRLIVRLQLMNEKQIHNMDRLTRSYRSNSLLDVDIPEVIIPVAPGRSLAVLVEAATRQHIQLVSGYNATEDFIQKQQQLLQS
jgi:HPr kinase/phosphorylase